MQRRLLTVSRAFTLVELLVVIGIIALLISLLLPALNKARRAGNNAYCLSNLHNIGQAIAMYTITSKGTLPFGWWGDYGNGVGGQPGPGEADWTTLLSQIIVSRSGNTYTDFATNTAISRKIFNDKDTLDFPEAPQNQWIHYSAHPRLMPAIGTADYATNAAGKVLMQPYKIGSIRRASELVLIMDGTQVTNPYNTGSASLQGRAAATTYQIDGHNLDGWPTNGVGFASYLWSARATAANGIGSQGATIQVANAGCVVPGPNIDCAGNQFTTSDGEIRWRHMGNTVANFLFVDGHCEGRHFKDATHCDLMRKNVNADTIN